MAHNAVHFRQYMLTLAPKISSGGILRRTVVCKKESKNLDSGMVQPRQLGLKLLIYIGGLSSHPSSRHVVLIVSVPVPAPIDYSLRSFYS